MSAAALQPTAAMDYLDIALKNGVEPFNHPSFFCFDAVNSKFVFP